MSNINTETLAELIMQELEEYAEDVDWNVKKVIERRAETVLAQLKSNPTIPKSKGSGKHFRKKGNKHYKDDFFATHQSGKSIIANNQFQLTYLLENGHAIIWKGRKFGRTKAYPHWALAQKEAEKATDEVKEVLRNANRRI